MYAEVALYITGTFLSLMSIGKTVLALWESDTKLIAATIVVVVGYICGNEAWMMYNQGFSHNSLVFALGACIVGTSFSFIAHFIIEHKDSNIKTEQ